MWTTSGLGFAILVSVVLPVVAQESLGVAMGKCAGIADDTGRLACFDALATVSVDDQADTADKADQADHADIDPPVAAAAATAVVAVDTGPVPLTDEVGKERIEPKGDDEQPRFTANVIACQKSLQSGQHYFTFENGQIWKQSNYRSLNFRDCEFGVEISKGALGYNMYIPSKDRSLRVARVK